MATPTYRRADGTAYNPIDNLERKIEDPKESSEPSTPQYRTAEEVLTKKPEVSVRPSAPTEEEALRGRTTKDVRSDLDKKLEEVTTPELNYKIDAVDRAIVTKMITSSSDGKTWDYDAQEVADHVASLSPKGFKTSLAPADIEAFREGIKPGQGASIIGQEFDLKKRMRSQEQITNDVLVDRWDVPYGKMASQMIRSAQEELNRDFTGISSRALNDWFDTGMDVIDQLYPDASPEVKEMLQEDLVNMTSRLLADGIPKALEHDDTLPWLVGKFLSPDLADIPAIGANPLAKGLRAALRDTVKVGAKGGAYNAGADIIYQSVEQAEGIKDDYEIIQTGGALVLGSGLPAGMTAMTHAIRGSQRGKIKRVLRKSYNPETQTIDLPNAEGGTTPNSVMSLNEESRLELLEILTDEQAAQLPSNFITGPTRLEDIGSIESSRSSYLEDFEAGRNPREMQAEILESARNARLIAKKSPPNSAERARAIAVHQDLMQTARDLRAIEFETLSLAERAERLSREGLGLNNVEFLPNFTPLKIGGDESDVVISAPDIEGKVRAEVWLPQTPNVIYRLETDPKIVEDPVKKSLTVSHQQIGGWDFEGSVEIHNLLTGESKIVRKPNVSELSSRREGESFEQGQKRRDKYFAEKEEWENSLPPRFGRLANEAVHEKARRLRNEGGEEPPWINASTKETHAEVSGRTSIRDLIFENQDTLFLQKVEDVFDTGGKGIKYKFAIKPSGLEGGRWQYVYGHFLYNSVTKKFHKVTIHGPGRTTSMNTALGPGGTKKMLKAFREYFPQSTGITENTRIFGPKNENRDANSAELRWKATGDGAEIIPFPRAPRADAENTSVDASLMRELENQWTEVIDEAEDVFLTTGSKIHSDALVNAYIARRESLLEELNATDRESLDDVGKEIYDDLLNTTVHNLSRLRGLLDLYAQGAGPAPQRLYRRAANDSAIDTLISKEQDSSRSYLNEPDSATSRIANDNDEAWTLESREGEIDQLRLESEVFKLMGDWKNPPPVRYWTSPEDIESPIARYDVERAIREGHTPLAFQTDGEIFLNTSLLGRGPEKIKAAVYHEALNHFGLREEFGRGLDPILDAVYKTNPKIRGAAANWLALNGDALSRNLSTAERFRYATEEALAHLPGSEIVKIKGWPKLVAYMRNMGRKIGLNIKYSDNDVRALLAAAHARVIDGKTNEGYTRWRDTIEPRTELSFSDSRTMFMTDDQRNRERIPGDNINRRHFFSDIHSSEDIDALLADAAREMGPISPQSREETELLAAQLNLTVEDLLDGRPDFTPEYALAARELLVDSVDRVLDLSRRITEGGDSSENRLQLARAIATFGHVFARVRNITSNAGRILDSFNIDVSGYGDRTAAINFMFENSSSLFANPKNITRLAEQIRRFENDPVALNRMMKDTFDPRAEDYIFSLWYNAVLSGPQTHIANVFGTASNYFVDMLAKSGAAISGQRRRFSKEAKANLQAGRDLKESALRLSRQAAETSDPALAKQQREAAKNMLKESEDAFKRGERVSGSEMVARVYGSILGLKAAYNNFPKAFKAGVPLHKVSRVEHNTAVLTSDGSSGKKGPWADTPVLKHSETATRLLAATDEFFRNVIMSSEFYGQAIRVAKIREGLSGPEMFERAQQLINELNDELIRGVKATSVEAIRIRQSADYYARLTQFLDDPRLPGAKALEKSRSPGYSPTVGGRIVSAGMRLAVPFVRTPDSLVRTGIRYSPLGVFEYENVKALRAGGAEADQAFMRIAMGSAFTYLMIDKFYNGELTGAGPVDYREGSEKQGYVGPDGESRFQPFSIKLGDQWYSYRGLEPLSVPLGVISTSMELIDSLEERKKKDALRTVGVIDEEVPTVGETIAVGTLGILKGMSTQTWTDSLMNLFEAVESSNSTGAGVNNYLAGIGASAVNPAIVRQLAQARDPIKRDTVGDGSIEDRFMGRVKAGIPGLSETLPPKYDVTGKELRRGEKPGDLGVMGRFLFRGEIAAKETNPVMLEMARLQDIQAGTMFTPVTRTNVTTNLGSQRINDQQFATYTKLAGMLTYKYFKDFMNSMDYQEMNDFERRRYAKEKIGPRARKEARHHLFGEKMPRDERDPEAHGYTYKTAAEVLGN